MPQERLTMRKLKDALRLHFECHLSNRKIAGALNTSPTTIGYYTKAAKLTGQDWSQLKMLDDQALMSILAPHCPQLSSRQEIQAEVEFDFAYIHQELKKKGVTRELLHQEYQRNHPAMKICSYAEFCRRYKRYKRQLQPSMRQSHVAGDKVFVDYAGPTITLYDADTGSTQQAVIFVGVLGASNYTYAEATLTRSLPDWIGAHARMLEFFGGVPNLIIPDNEKSAVSKACQYDPEVNPNYAAFAAHYGTAILPTRPYHPKDKAKVENAVLVVERWILAQIRHQKFFSVRELNQAIAKLLSHLNNKPFKKLPGSRRSAFEQLDQPALKPLPVTKYEFAYITRVKVRLDYHIEIDQHAYSVPHHHIHQTVEIHLGDKMIAVFYRGKRIALHARSHELGGATTITEHMPKAHQHYQQWTPQVFLSWAQSIGKATTRVASYLIKHRPNPECCYRIHGGFKSLAKRYSGARLEQACQYADQHQLHSYSHIESILKTQIDKAPMMAVNDPSTEAIKPNSSHHNVRGAQYYLTSLKETQS